jgi:LPPG:FO 2-phospho-L-lactate transferase
MEISKYPRQVVAFAGGVGGAKLVDGLARVLPAGALTVIVNTGDDFRYMGLAVCPDLDTVMYTLAGLAHPINGWGLADDTRQMVGMLQHYGEAGWFGLGDKDLATNLLRTQLLAQGQPLGEVTAWLCGRLGIGARLLPATDDAVATMVETDSHGLLPFQDYFVRHRWQPVVRKLHYQGAGQARPSPGLLDALNEADLLIFCPSNPVLSIAPILAVPAIAAAVEGRRVPLLAVSPVVAGAALKGPTVKIMTELGYDPSVAGIANHYGQLIDGFVVDTQDADVQITQPKLVAPIILDTTARRVALANHLLAWAAEGIS